MALLAAALCVLALPCALGQFERRVFIDGTVTFTPPGVGDCPPGASDACSNYTATTGTTSDYQFGDVHVLIYNASQVSPVPAMSALAGTAPAKQLPAGSCRLAH